MTATIHLAWIPDESQEQHPALDVVIDLDTDFAEGDIGELRIRQGDDTVIWDRGRAPELIHAIAEACGLRVQTGERNAS